MKITQEIKVNIPDVATKSLKIQEINNKRRVTLSSNWLLMFGFDGKQVVETSLGKNKGIKVSLASQKEIDEKKSKKVYSRTYTSRSANPLNPLRNRKERLIQITSQKLINESLGTCTHVHITLMHGSVIFRPVSEIQHKALKELDPNAQISALVAMTGGVDCHTLERSGFSISTIIEYRPNEKRDTADYTEMTSLSALVNSKPRVLINEDIYKLDLNRLSSIIGENPITVGHFSLQCDDYTTLKTKKQKSESVVNLDSTLDMFIPMLGILDTLKIPVLVVENVPGFLSSPINDVVVLQLKRRGYKVNQEIFDAREHGGLTSRKRLYLVATTLESEFSFPEKTAYSRSVWDEVIVPNLAEIMERDITDLKVLKDSLTTGRIRVITKDKAFSPTLTKSQGNESKDSVVIEHEGRYYRPSVKVQKLLNCIPDSFDLAWAPIDKSAQIIGQSICASMHEKIMASVKTHIRKEQERKIVENDLVA